MLRFGNFLGGGDVDPNKHLLRKKILHDFVNNGILARHFCLLEECSSEVSVNTGGGQGHFDNVQNTSRYFSRWLSSVTQSVSKPVIYSISRGFDI